MKFIDALFGRDLTSRKNEAAAAPSDAAAIEEYERLLRNAPPETLEQIHQEAFAKLTPKQRDLMFDAFVERAEAPSERPADATSASLARTATALEEKRPGMLARLFGGRERSFGVDNTLLNTYLAYAIGSELAFGFLVSSAYLDGDPDGGQQDFSSGLDGLL